MSHGLGIVALLVGEHGEVEDDEQADESESRQHEKVQNPVRHVPLREVKAGRTMLDSNQRLSLPGCSAS